VTTDKSTKGLGLLYNIGKIYIKKSVINTVVGMNMPGNIDITTFISELNKTEIEVDKLTAIPAFTVTTYWNPIQRPIEAIGKIEKIYLDEIEKIRMDISNFHDVTARDTQTYDCKLTMTDIPITFLSDITRGVKSFLSGIDLAATEVKIVADKSIYEKIYTTVLLIHDFIQEKKNNIRERLEVMNSLSNNIIPPALPYLLDSLECLQSGDLEHIDIVYCDRSKIGLFCELTVSVHKKLAEYEK
jgi:hypothetical protein